MKRGWLLFKVTIGVNRWPIFTTEEADKEEVEKKRRFLESIFAKNSNKH